METGESPSRPRLSFGRQGASSAATKGATGRKHLPVEDALARMAGKIGERRRASPPSVLDDEDESGVTA